MNFNLVNKMLISQLHNSSIALHIMQTTMFLYGLKVLVQDLHGNIFKSAWQQQAAHVWFLVIAFVWGSQYACVLVCVCMCTCVYMYVYVCVCVCTCVCTCVYIHMCGYICPFQGYKLAWGSVYPIYTTLLDKREANEQSHVTGCD